MIEQLSNKQLINQIVLTRLFIEINASLLCTTVTQKIKQILVDIQNDNFLWKVILFLKPKSCYVKCPEYNNLRISSQYYSL